MTKKSETKAPALIAWHVREAKGGKSYWTRIGAAWPHQNGDGHTLQLDLYPLDGRIVLLCGSAWKRDPGSGVIGVEKGPLIPVV